MKCCVAYVNLLFDNVLTQEVIEAESEIDACVKFLCQKCEEVGHPLDEDYKKHLKSLVHWKNFKNTPSSKIFCFTQSK